jgi:hypothetical protein
MFHQIIHRGETRQAAVVSATRCAGASLLPFCLGLGASAFVTFQGITGLNAAIVFGCGFALTGFVLLFGLGLALKRTPGETSMEQQTASTPLGTKIEQMLTEARVIIPGGQALLGFQFIAMFTSVFRELPAAIQALHAAALCAVALAALLLMTPAALHRIAFAGEDDDGFFRIGSRLVIAASLPLAMGIAGDIGVVFYVISRDVAACIASAVIAFCLLAGVWLVYPATQRRKVP